MGARQGTPARGSASVGRYGSWVSSTACAAPRRSVAKVDRGGALHGGWQQIATSAMGPGLSRPIVNFTPLRLGHVPGPVQEAVAIGLARGRVLLEGVERLALIGPDLLAVVTDHDGHVGGRLGIVGGCERRPVLGAGPVAGRLATDVLVEGIKGHTLGIDKGLALWRVGCLQHLRRRRG